MRYKELTSKKIEQLEFMLKNLELLVSRGESQDVLKNFITDKIYEKVEEIRFNVSLENED